MKTFLKFVLAGTGTIAFAFTTLSAPSLPTEPSCPPGKSTLPTDPYDWHVVHDMAAGGETQEEACTDAKLNGYAASASLMLDFNQWCENTIGGEPVNTWDPRGGIEVPTNCRCEYDGIYWFCEIDDYYEAAGKCCVD